MIPSSATLPTSKTSSRRPSREILTRAVDADSAERPGDGWNQSRHPQSIRSPDPAMATGQVT